MVYDWTPANSGEFYLVGGDSGAPSFVRLSGRAVMIGSHYGVSTTPRRPNPGDISVDSYLPYYISQLNARSWPSTPTRPTQTGNR